MKRTLPLIITALSGFVLLLAFFLPFAQSWGEAAAIWFDVLAAMAFILGGGNLLAQHLRKISDRRKGWGYSGITVVAFLITLFFGLTKWGAWPLGKTEFLGESFVSYPIEGLPKYSVPGELTTRADGELLPMSVRRQLTDEGEQVTFQGWMTDSQLEDLIKYQDDLRWRALVEELHKKAQPPAELKSKLKYHADQGALSFAGMMTPAEEAILRTTLAAAGQAGIDQFKDDKSRVDPAEPAESASETKDEKVLKPLDPVAEAAIDQMAAASRVQTSVFIRAGTVPQSFAIPEDQQNRVTLTSDTGAMEATPRRKLSVTGLSKSYDVNVGDTLTVTGPMSPKFRDELANKWANLPRVRSWSPQQRDSLRQQLEQLGPPLSPAQREVFDKFWDKHDTSAPVLKLQLNSAGVAEPGEKTYRELYNEYLAGERYLTRVIPPKEANVSLNAAQEAVVDQYAADGAITAEQLKANLSAAGAITPGMLSKIDEYEASLPTEATVYRDLCLELLKVGNLNSDQQTFLTQFYRQHFEWQQAVGQLAVNAHQTKYPWSGDYDESGTPFWWLYQYVFQPLLTTTFAVLAFYVASAAFRAFRAKNLEATLLLGTAFIILLRPTFLGAIYTAVMPEALGMDNLTSFIMGTMNTAGNRAIMIGIALGIASTSLKVLLGIDRSYLGSGDE